MTFKTAHTFEIILPDVDNGTPNAPLPEHHNYLKGFLAELFGGFTSFAAEGGWRDGSGAIVAESVIVYRASVMTDFDAQQYRNAMITLAANLKAMAKQDAIYMSYRREEVSIA